MVNVTINPFLDVRFGYLRSVLNNFGCC